MSNQNDEKQSPIHNLLKDTQPQPTNVSRRRFIQTGSLTAAASATIMLTGCGDDNNGDGGIFDPASQIVISFSHGVASGDPLSDRVIIWTRITPQKLGSTHQVIWQVANDKQFSSIVSQGKVSADGSKDYTVKVDVTGLKPNQSYYYRFICNNAISPVGKTKTLPVGQVNQVKFAVVSCSNYPAGYFHAYADIAKRNDIDVVLHLGDYIYEYGRTVTTSTGTTLTAYASSNAKKLQREVLPAEELLTITAYRERYAQYRTDKDLQTLHAAMPMIAIWDDHEISNDAYKDGAENHQANEGKWDDRKLAAMTAYHEWMPTRNNVVNQIYRSFDFGDLISLHMLDTRVIARDKQLDYNNYLVPDAATGQITLDAKKFTAAMMDSSRQMIGSSQQNWLAEKMQTSKATWQILGQQVLMGKMYIPSPVLLNFIDPRLGVSAVAYMGLLQKAQQAPMSLTQQEQAILQAPSIPYNLDAWDGYAVAREQVFAIAKSLQKNLVVLAGDTHNAWANNLINNKGEAVGVEFATTSVTSPGFEEYLPNVDPKQLAAGLPYLVESKTLKWCDTSRRGYLVLTVTPQQCVCDWVFVSDILQTTYSSTVDKTMTVKAGQPYLV